MEATRTIQSKSPLSGRRIIVTRARAQASAFTRALEALGAEPIEFPTIEIAPPKSYRELDNAISNIDSYDWIIFTSVNGVDSLSGRLKIRNRTLNGKPRAAAIGPETAKAVEVLGLRPEVVPEEYRAEAILGKLRPEEMRGRRILVPRAAEARDVLIRTLRDWGAEVDVVEAYRTVAPTIDPAPLRARFRAGEIDMVTFTSSSTVKNFSAIFGTAHLSRLLARTAVACIGPITRETATGLGMRVDVVAQDYTISGLTDAIAQYYSNIRTS
ncbi:MAG TPA: uroporphyrinogen-III synthase [Candidatus Binatia bacterium]|nr:uroporphyrinogen-III synthase [Candidatus Binatia bacterium]